MKYFKNPEDDKIYAYDENQQAMAEEAIRVGWVDITDSWSPPVNPPAPTPEQRQARVYLKDTDWYVVRMTETGVPIPPDVSEKRAAARLLL